MAPNEKKFNRDTVTVRSSVSEDGPHSGGYGSTPGFTGEVSAQAVPAEFSPEMKLASQLLVRTHELPDGRFLTEWLSNGRRGDVLTDPSPGPHRRIIAELLALHVVTSLVRPLKIKDFVNGARIGVSVSEIPSIVAGEYGTEKLKCFAKFIRHSLHSLPIQILRKDEWPAMENGIHCESFELLGNEPWEDAVKLTDNIMVCPTILALDTMMGFLKTSQQWKVWVTLYTQSPTALKLPPSIVEAGEDTEAYLIPRFGWLLLVKNARIVSVRVARAYQIPRLFAYLLGLVPAVPEETLTHIAIAAIDQCVAHVDRTRVLDAALGALPSASRRIMFDDPALDNTTFIHSVLKACLGPVSTPQSRASAYRTMLSHLSFEESHIALPDGTYAAITGHAIDRMLTRFNIRSASTAMRYLHHAAPGLVEVRLPPIVEVSKSLKYNVNAKHWRAAGKWTLVVSAQTILTVYFPKKF